MKNQRNRIKEAALLGMFGICLSGIVTGCEKNPAFFTSIKAKNLSAQYQEEKQETVGEVSEEFCAAYADFSFHLLREGRNCAKEETNTFVSPLSVMTALEMTRFGADGETESQMSQVLYGSLSGEEGRKNLVTFTDGLTKDEEVSFIEANSIWFHAGEESVGPKETFLKRNGADFNADIFMASFDQSTVNDINTWVNKKTEGNVSEILDKIPRNAQMYLVNASSFDAQWLEIYEETQICKDDVFTCADGTKRTIDMMHSEESSYLCGEKETGFRKPYREGYSFVALLPEEDIPIDDYVNQLTGENFVKLLEEEKDTEVIAHLPKFEADTSLELSDALSEIGMPFAFDKNKAEFPEILEGTKDQVWINRVLHKTHIQVDEQGTKAGAATVVEILKETAAQEEEEPKEVYLNRPFVYAIVDDDTKLPIFIGTAEDIGK